MNKKENIVILTPNYSIPALWSQWL